MHDAISYTFLTCQNKTLVEGENGRFPTKLAIIKP